MIPPEILDRLKAIIKSSFRENGAMIRCQDRNVDDKKFLLRNYLIYYSGEPAHSIERLYKLCENCISRQNTFLNNLKLHLGL